MEAPEPKEQRVADSVREDIIVEASPRTVLETAGDVGSYPQWQPEISSVDVMETDEQGRVTKAAFVIDAKVMTVSCTLAYTYDQAGMHWRLLHGEGLNRNDGAYLVEDIGDGRTRLTYALDVEPTMPVPGIIRRQVAQRIVDSALRAVKRRAEAAA